MSDPEPLTAADIAPILKRLDAVIGLLARVQPKSERATLTERVGLLIDLGLDNPSIARIVGRTVNNVHTIRERLRATKGRKKGNKKGKKSGQRKGRAARSGRC